MDKQKTIKYTKISAVVLLILSASGYYLYDHAVEFGMAKPALVLTISTNLTEYGTPMINNVTFEQSSVPFFYKRADSIPKFPEIDVKVRINDLTSAPASYWASTPYEGEGTYEITLFFRDGSEPKPDDVLIMTIRIISRTGAVAYKTTAFWLWE